MAKEEELTRAENLFFDAVEAGNYGLATARGREIGVERAVGLTRDGLTALHLCAQACAGRRPVLSDLDIAKWLVENNADVSARQNIDEANIQFLPMHSLTCLNSDISNDNVLAVCQFVDLLLGRGADINAVSMTSVDTEKKNGKTPLFYVAGSSAHTILLDKPPSKENFSRLKGEMFQRIINLIHCRSIDDFVNSGIIAADCPMVTVYKHLLSRGADQQYIFARKSPLDTVMGSIESVWNSAEEAMDREFNANVGNWRDRVKVKPQVSTPAVAA